MLEAIDEDFDYTGGNATVVANFAAGTVDVSLGNFIVRDGDGGIGFSAPIDTIEITGMAISGNAFSGGTLELFENTTLTGRDVVPVTDVTGANFTTTATGHFFGWTTPTPTPPTTYLMK